jgi:hypothetical protein
MSLDLFVKEGEVIKPKEMTLMVKEFSTLWERDESEKKTQALQEFKYIQLLLHPLSPYEGYPEEERPKKVAENVFNNKKYKPDKDVRAAMDFYIEFRKKASPSIRLYQAAKGTIDKVTVYMEDMDFSERDSRGNLVYAPSDALKNIKELAPVLSSLKELKKRVETEVFESRKTTKDRKINHFEK